MTKSRNQFINAAHYSKFGFWISFVICPSSFFPRRFILKTSDAAKSAPAEMSSGTRGQWLVLIAAFLGWMFDGLEMGIFPLVARPALQDMMGVAGGGDKLIAPWMAIIT